ncbi:UNVERIFIED_CONTAM: Hexose carrier protein HEX6 [Sesamum calycinum]|uniref:Hexose carrier protein HEX6 n=1 Tax=Sesamum calycinum TaxID=2727403 RepID=A0AAW2JDU5_9LAMI
MSEPVHYNGKITRFVLLSSVIAATGGLIFGYGTGVAGGVASMGPFLKKFFPAIYRQMNEKRVVSNYCKFNSQLLTSFTSSVLLSGLLATFFASSVTRALGRRASILIGGLAFIAGSALGGAANNIYLLIFGRLLLGVGFGFTNQSVPLYLSEMAPPKYRGAFNFGFQLCIGSGGLLSSLVNYGTVKISGGWGWRLSLAMVAAPAFVLTVWAPFLPETPNSLVQQGNEEKAKRMLQKIRGTNDVEAEFDDLITASNASKTIKHPFKKILQRKYRPQLVMSVAIPFFQQVTGISVISFLCSDTVSNNWFWSKRFSDVVRGSWISRDGDDPLVGLDSRQAWQKGLVPFRRVSNVHPTNDDWSGNGSKTRGSRCNEQRTFLSMLCCFKASIFFFFAAWVAVMTAFVYAFLPETKDVPIEKMEKIWREHWFWKRYVDDGAEYEVDKTEGP